MTTEMTQRPESQLAPYGEGNGFTGQFDQDDLAVPIVTLVQPITKEKGDAQVGEFLFPDGRHFNTLDAVTLGVAATRSLMGNIDLDEGVICSSNDRRIGNTDNPLKVLGEEEFAARGIENASTMLPCEGCTHYDDDQYSNADYLCKKGYTLVMADTTSGDVFLYFVKGSAMKMVIRRVVSPAIARKQRGERAAPWLNPFRWEAKIKENQKGKFYVPEIVPGPPFSDEDAARYAELSARFGGRAAEQMESEDLEPEEEQQPGHPGLGAD